ncbi:MAG: T9SS type A sorting domain-containing protein [Bacteroidota bacterium]
MRVFPLAALALLAAPLVSAQTWTNADVRGYGYVTGLLAHPETESVYSRTDVGGIFRWTGDRWQPLLDGQFRRTQRWSPDVESFALDPRVPGRIWAALGGNLDGIGPGAVIVRSDDDGATWTATAFPREVGMAGNGSWRRAGERLAVDPNNSDVVYFGSRVDGLWRTLDGGATWERVASFPTVGDDGGPDDGPCTEPNLDGCGPGGLPFVVFDPADTITRGGQTVTANVYVGTMGEGVYRSADGGETWALAVPMEGTRDNPMRAEFAHGRLQVAVTGDGGNPYDGAILVYTPDGTGGTVADKTPPDPCPVYGPYDWNAIAAHPTDPDFVVAIPFGVVTRKVFFSRNFTAETPTWEIQTDEGPYTQCPDQQLDSVVKLPPWAEEGDGVYSYGGAALIDRADPRQVWITNGWGIYRYDDILQDGTTLDFVGVMRGMEELCIHDVEAPGGPGPAFHSAVFDAFGFSHISAAQMPATTFEKGAQQNGTDVAVTPADPLVAISVAARNSGYLTASRITRDGGQTWADLPGLGDPLDPDDACTAFLTAGNIAISATDPDRMVWSPQRQIWPACNGFSERVVTPPHVTSDAGQTWRPVQGYDVPGGNWAAGGDFVVSQHLVADRVDGDRFYAYVKLVEPPFGTQLWTSADGGETWSNACSDCLPDFRFPRLEAHPQRAGEVWASFVKTFDVDAQADLYRTTDFGATWSQITSADSVWAFGFGAPLPGESRATVYAHAYIDGEEAIWYSTDDAASWQRFGGTERVPIGLFADLAGDPDQPGVVYAGSLCRGAWVGSLGVATTTETASAGMEVSAVIPNPAAGALSVRVRSEAPGTLRATVLDLLGREIATFAPIALAGGVHQSVEVDGQGLTPGTYILRLVVGQTTVTRRFSIVR